MTSNHHFLSSIHQYIYQQADLNVSLSTNANLYIYKSFSTQKYKNSLFIKAQNFKTITYINTSIQTYQLLPVKFSWNSCPILISRANK